MRLFLMCILVLTLICTGSPAMAGCGLCGSGSKTAAPAEETGDPMTDDSPEESLDNRMGYDTSNRLAAEGPSNYNDNTGLMDVVPSDSEGDIED